MTDPQATQTQAPERWIRRAEQRYLPDVTVPLRARDFVGEFLAAVGAADLEERADLLTSDLVADAVRHAPSQVVVRLAFDRNALRVEISDDPGIIADPDAGKAERELSRRHAEALASRWGSSFSRDVTTTWFELQAA